MMEGLAELEARLDLLRALLDDVDSADRLGSIDPADLGHGDAEDRVRAEIGLLSVNITTRRVYAYASCTTLLYAAFEQFTETLLMEFLEELNRIVPTYPGVPRAIRGTHAMNSARLILNLGLDKYRNRTGPEEVARNLASCSAGGAYRLNSLAYIDHTANLRIETVKSLFKDVGVPGVGRLVRECEEFQPYLAGAFPDGGVEHFRDAVVFNDLEDLVDRRNVIGHGWPDETLSVGLMAERIEFVRLLSRSLHAVLRQALCPHLLQHAARALPEPASVFDNSIVCLDLEDGGLQVGGRVIARRLDGGLVEGRIMSLEIDHAPIDQVVAPPKVGVGFRLDTKVKQEYEFFSVTEDEPQQAATGLPAESVTPA